MIDADYVLFYNGMRSFIGRVTNRNDITGMIKVRWHAFYETWEDPATLRELYEYEYAMAGLNYHNDDFNEDGTENEDKKERFNWLI